MDDLGALCSLFTALYTAPMSPRKKSRERKTNWFVPIFVGVVMGSVAFAVSDTSSRDLPVSDEGVATSTTEFATEASVRIHVGMRVPKADRDTLYSIDLATEETVPVEVEKGWRVESLHEATSLKPVPHEERGVTLTDGGEWNVVLRAPTGEAYTEPRVLGMFDDRHAAVLARTDRFRILNVSRDGRIVTLKDVPENGTVIGFSGHAAWISTFTAGEGIESELSGPSELIRVSFDGSSSVVGSERERVIVGVVSDGNNHAYWHDEGFAAPGDDGAFSGEGRPLLWLETGELLVSKGVTLLLYRDGVGATISSALPAPLVAARIVE